ncbi:hypothetical protein Hanom_Chr09g00829041 [Helianthus anomalus]
MLVFLLLFFGSTYSSSMLIISISYLSQKDVTSFKSESKPSSRYLCNSSLVDLTSSTAFKIS